METGIAVGRNSITFHSVKCFCGSAQFWSCARPCMAVANGHGQFQPSVRNGRHMGSSGPGVGVGGRVLPQGRLGETAQRE